MALVTIGLLALAFSHAGRGASRPAEVVVHSFAAGFGLEFLGSAWVASSFLRSRDG